MARKRQPLQEREAGRRVEQILAGLRSPSSLSASSDLSQVPEDTLRKFDAYKRRLDDELELRKKNAAKLTNPALREIYEDLMKIREEYGNTRALEIKGSIYLSKAAGLLAREEGENPLELLIQAHDLSRTASDRVTQLNGTREHRILSYAADTAENIFDTLDAGEDPNEKKKWGERCVEERKEVIKGAEQEGERDLAERHHSFLANIACKLGDMVSPSEERRKWYHLASESKRRAAEAEKDAWRRMHTYRFAGEFTKKLAEVTRDPEEAASIAREAYSCFRESLRALDLSQRDNRTKEIYRERIREIAR